jgi:indolepyruvate ferredoxin oxidoreductase, beta subunit
MSKSTIEKVDFVLVGVGGQGTVLASDVLGEVGLQMGLDAKQSEIHGMSQRGGSVTSQVRWGKKVYSPLIGKGEADYLVAFELLEAARSAELLRPGGVAIINDQRIPPVSVSSQGAVYPELAAVRQVLEQVTSRIHLVPAQAAAEEVGSAKAANVVLLGALSSFLDMDEGIWLQVIEKRVPAKFVELNRKAFLKGRELIRR